MTELRDLDLRSNAIGAPGAIALAESPHMHRLKSLNLSKNAIGDDGARALADSPHLAQLTELRLEGQRASRSSPASQPTASDEFAPLLRSSRED